MVARKQWRTERGVCRGRPRTRASRGGRGIETRIETRVGAGAGVEVEAILVPVRGVVVVVVVL